MTKRLSVSTESIERRICMIRGEKVMLDADLAVLYQVETKTLNRAVRRNLSRFPDDFMFQLTTEELEILRCQIGTSSWGGRRYQPYAFTEHGVAMLSSVLNSKRAVQVNLRIIRAFIALRETLTMHKDLARKVEELQRQQKQHSEQLVSVYTIVKSLVEPLTRPKKHIGFPGTGSARSRETRAAKPPALLQ
jgi:phage regulator Rha-like protein